ncbi:WD repeat-containing protein 60-like isoform X2 [Pomacea canaliculata]|uniref:WD repeat-containing protein 60-like isoform X2 n=1 Tax=Pomacea canaliculata TaxID=400727 RepID=UPI000D729749|nr:WD repeat-containing protein 60-like isoform X2 [Pomacea canaliculata]
MPPGKSKPKDDTWTTNELNQALKGARGDQDRKRRSRNDDDDRRLKHHDEGDASRRKHKDGSKRSHRREDDGGKDKSRSNRDASPEPLVGLTEEDRERLRQERRERRGGKTEKKEEKPQHKEEKPVDNNEDIIRRHHRDEEERRRRKETNDERYAKGDRGQSKDREEREPRQADKERRHEKGNRERRHEERDKEQRREKSDRERRYEDADREKRHEERETERRHKKDDSERKREKEDTERRHEKDGRGRHFKTDEEEHDYNRNEREQHIEREYKIQRRHRSGKESEHREVDEDEYERSHHEKREKREKHNRQTEGMELTAQELAKRENHHRERDDDRDHGRYQQDKDVKNGEDKNRDREREERRRRREKEKEERHKDRKEKQKDPDEWTKERENYHRSRDSEKDKQSQQEQNKEQQNAKYEKKQKEGKANAEDNYDEYEDDFEDYEEDFEEENQDIQQDSDSGGDDQDVQDYNRNRMPEKTHPKSFINFVSAKQRVMNKSAASRARHRAEDLQNMIELDTVCYDMLDLPPVKEYELYIRSFGRSNTKQAYVQTNEDAVERDVQTEKADDLKKWTQHPADDIDACGGEGLLVKESSSHTRANSNLETIALGHFLEQSAQIFSTLLEEERGLGERSDCTADKSNLSISEGVTQLASLPFLAGRYVKQASFCLLQPHVFLTIYSKPKEVSEENPIDNYGLICVWNTKEIAYPQRILTSVSEPTCACFSPIRASLVIAGLVDGSVCVWDLREPSSLHRTVFLQDQDVCIRFPTYNTAGVSEKENHHSPVVAITAVHPTVLRKEVEESYFENTLGLSFQLASVEENAVINLWVVTEIPLPDMAGSGIDLGLAPGGRIKLVHTSSITLESPNKNVQAGNPRARDVKLNPSDLNHFFVATDLGQVIHGVRFGSRVYPRVFQPVADSPCCVTCIDFSPFGEPYFLAGCEDGTVNLYHTSSEHPLTSWSTFSSGYSIVSIQWSQSRPAVFFVLNTNSVVFVFDLTETGLSPVHTDQVSSDRVTFMAVASDPVITGIGKSQPAHFLLCLGNGVTELHSVCAGLRQQQPLEREFLAHYQERF